jgi:hypothetical protein
MLSGEAKLHTYGKLLIPADSTELDEIPGVSLLNLAERDKLTQFSD